MAGRGGVPNLRAQRRRSIVIARVLARGHAACSAVGSALHGHGPHLSLRIGGLRQPIRLRPLIRILKGRRFDVTRDDYEPTVTIVVPLFNEGHSIYDTIVSLVSIDYPPEKLSVTVVDDCSTDDSYAWALRAAQQFPDRVARAEEPAQHGQAHAASTTPCARRGTPRSSSAVDSDVIVDPGAVRALVARFTGPTTSPRSAGACTCRTPTRTGCSRMQTIKYFFGQEMLKNLERDDALGDVSVGLSHRLSPLGARRARARSGEPQRSSACRSSTAKIAS